MASAALFANVSTIRQDRDKPRRVAHAVGFEALGNFFSRRRIPVFPDETAYKPETLCLAFGQHVGPFV